MAATQNQANLSDVFAIVQQVASQINKDRVQEFIDGTKGFDTKDSQLIVDLLCATLEKNHHLLKNGDRALLLLTQIALSANVIAQNRIIKPEHIVSNDEQASYVYQMPDNSPVYLKMVRPGKKDGTQAFSEDLIKWAHLCHVNILPVYGAHLGEVGPLSLVSPQITTGNIVENAKSLARAARVTLISDAIDGLCYLHSLNIVHGLLNPENILISHDGRALITGLDSSSESQDSDSFSVRYLGPEMLEDDGARPTTASNMWSLGCVIYEVLSGKVPFHQIRNEFKVGMAITSGKKPGQGGDIAEEIGDAIWRPVSTCWEPNPKDRPSCLQMQRVFSTIVTPNDRPASKSITEYTEDPNLNVDYARSIFLQIIGSDISMPLPTKVPENLQNPLSGLCDSVAKAETVAVATKKLSQDDTQSLVDVLDLIIEEDLSTLNSFNPTAHLLTKVMMSTHILPQRYKISRVQYDPTPIAEGDFGKVYKGRDLDVCVNMVTDPGDISVILDYLAIWAHALHPNVVPFYGIFHEVVDDLPQLCLVSPYLKIGLLRHYAPRLPQSDRVPLISDAINALIYMYDLDIRYNDVSGEDFLISDEGRALIASFGSSEILTSPAKTEAVNSSEPYTVRFYSPESVTKDESSEAATVWSFGCLVYEVLSRKPPYHHFIKESQIRSALSQGEVPTRPISTADGGIDEISDRFWALIMECCVPDPADRLTLLEVRKKLENMEIQDNRPEETTLHGAETLALSSSPDIDWVSVKRLLDQVQVELLRAPLSKLIQSHTKDVAAAAVKLDSEDVPILVDFLDLALKNHITLSDERNRVLALLSRVTTLTHIFPRRYELKGVIYHPLPIAEGGYGTVHRGVSDPKLCVKVMTKVESNALVGFIKELILWAHASHPNVLPFYGVFLNESQRICLVSPFMNKGNLHDYAPRLPQRNRLPLLHDVIKGLVYLHGLGVVHTDLKGENVLISDEGGALITDFGASHVITATVKGGNTTASVASTLRFTAPEIILNRHSRPTQECDIWSFGCLCYEVLSRKLPYFEYRLEAQILAALARKQLPKRPSSTSDDADDDEDGWDEFDERDWDEIDDPSWNIIKRCCAPNPEERPNASRIQELIVDLKGDTRLEARGTSGVHLLPLRSNTAVNLNRAKELLDTLQVWILARETLKYNTGDIISAVKRLKLDDDDEDALMGFWGLVLKDHLLISGEHNQALNLLSALIHSTGNVPYRYTILSSVQHLRVSIGRGSFGTVHRGVESSLCIKVAYFARLHVDLDAQWDKALAPSAYVSHTNVLPLYGTFFKEANVGSVGFLISPFITNGNLHNYATRLPQESRIPLICDIIEALSYLHGLGIVHGNLKGENVLISDEGRALVADFRPYHFNVAAAEGGPTGPYITSTLRFTAPELVKNRHMLPTTESDIWSIGCLIYLVHSGKVPFHQYSDDAEIRSALSQEELPARPASTDDGVNEIDDQPWIIITKCCTPDPNDRPTLSDIRNWLTKLGAQDDRPPPKSLPGAEILKLRRTYHGVDVPRAGDVMARIISQLPPITQEGEMEDGIRD